MRLVDILDTYPFVDQVEVTRVNGDQLRRLLEQSLTLERGLLQVSGLEIVYDMSRPRGERLVAMKHDGRSIEASDSFEVAAATFLSEGGDLYDAFREGEHLRSAGKVSDVLIDYFRSRDLVDVPVRGRQIQQ